MPQSLFGDTPTIGSADNAESVYTMATRITFAVAGTIVGVRRWGTTNAPTGTPQAAIFATTGGAPLNTPENFGAFQANQWNTKMLAVPYQVSAGQTLDIAVGPLSRYAATLAVFSSNLVVGDLTGTAGRFVANAALTFPTTGTTTWYSIDVLFNGTNAGTLQSLAGAATASMSGALIDPGELALAAAPAAFEGLGGLINPGVASMALSGFSFEAAAELINSGSLAATAPAVQVLLQQRISTGFRAGSTSVRKLFHQTGGG